MIPGTALPATRPVIDDTVQPVQAAKAISDILSEFSPGQRLQAVIQGQTANGTYRAIIAQRDVTLALPFSAKTGDALELEVVETQGRRALAVVAKPTAEGAAAAKESATATLSQTGRLIGSLIFDPDAGDAGTTPKATTLNGGQPILPAPPRGSGAELAPALAKAVTQSGLFYESHQSAWASVRTASSGSAVSPNIAPPHSSQPHAQGASPSDSKATLSPNSVTVIQTTDLATAAKADGGLTLLTPSSIGRSQLLQEPQGQIPAQPAPRNPVLPGGPTQADHSGGPTVSPSPAAPLPASQSGSGSQAGNQPPPGNPLGEVRSSVASASANTIPAEIRPIVQQQLTALATNVYAFHGQAWPGQQIHWEVIDADAQSGNERGDESAPQWRTRLRLSMPSLGAVDAALTLHAGRLSIRLDGRDAATAVRLEQGSNDLRQHLQDAGVTLAKLEIHTTQAIRDEPP